MRVDGATYAVLELQVQLGDLIHLVHTSSLHILLGCVLNHVANLEATDDLVLGDRSSAVITAVELQLLVIISA